MLRVLGTRLPAVRKKRGGSNNIDLSRCIAVRTDPDVNNHGWEEPHMKMLKLAGIGMLCASAGLTSAPALAQAEQDESARSNAIMETITTTSRKRAVAEIAQDVPLSSTPFSAAKIDAIAAVDMIDMGRLVPGARFENHGNSPGYALFFVRGVVWVLQFPASTPQSASSLMASSWASKASP